MIIDTHAHVDQLQDLSGAMQRAFDAGVVAIVAMSVDASSMRKVMHIAQDNTRPRIYPALGIHPGNIQPQEQEEAFDLIRQNAKEIIAIGETGLDFWYAWARKDQDAQERQKASFDTHLSLAKELDLPIVIHSRGAWKEALRMTQDAGVTRALFHWYSGPLDVLRQILDSGYFVSTSPSVAYSQPSQEAMQLAPLERILVETDSPVRFRGPDGDYTAEPKDVWNTVKALSHLKHEPEERILRLVNANACSFFRIKHEQ